jgi:hypothetical protein
MTLQKSADQWPHEAANRQTGGPYEIDTTFTKNKAFASWLQNVGAATGNTISLNQVDSDLMSLSPIGGGQRWIYTSQNSGGGTHPEHVRYFSVNTPIGGNPPPADAGPDAGPSYCGKAVYSDIHVGAGQNASTVPTTCNTQPLTAQEKALEFLFFDLSSCVQDDSKPPKPPNKLH